VGRRVGGRPKLFCNDSETTGLMGMPISDFNGCQNKDIVKE
jgi:hypothetical protein